MPVTCAISTSERPPLCWPVLSAIAPTVWGPWGKAGQQSSMRSALAEAAAQFARGPRSDRDLTRHAGAASRADQATGRAHIITPLGQMKGYAAAVPRPLSSRHVY